MEKLFNTIVEIAEERLEKEKETSITEETLHLISLAIQMRPWINPVQDV